MRKFSLKTDSFEVKELDEYLLSINGIKEVEIKNEDLVMVTVTYDEKVIVENIVKLEILAFLHALKWPSVYEFDRHSKEKTNIYKIERDSICCEFCYASIIEDLYEIDGILKVESNFYHKFFLNRHDGEKYYINIYYNPLILTEKDMVDIENNLDIYG